MDITYILREDTAYGITALDEKGKEVAYVPCISLSREKVTNLITLCNSEKLELIHLRDVVSDLQYELSKKA